MGHLNLFNTEGCSDGRAIKLNNGLFPLLNFCLAVCYCSPSVIAILLYATNRLLKPQLSDQLMKNDEYKKERKLSAFQFCLIGHYCSRSSSFHMQITV